MIGTVNPGDGSSGSLGENDDFFGDLLGTTGTVWTAEEQQKLEDALTRFPGDKFSSTERYLQIAALFQSKTARDVALRVRWLSMQARKSMEDSSLRRKPNTPRAPASSVAMRPGQTTSSAAQVQHVTPTAALAAAAAAAGAPITPFGSTNVSDDPLGNLPAPGTVSPEVATSIIISLMEANYSILNQFKNNMSQCKVVENTELLMRYRDNMVTALQHMSGMPGIMSQMPPLPVQPNLELASKFLPPVKPGQLVASMMPPHASMPPMQMPPFPFNPAAPGMMPPSAGMPMPNMQPGMEGFFPPNGGMPPGMHMPPGMVPPNGMHMPPGMPNGAMHGLLPNGMHMPMMPHPGMPPPHGMPPPGMLPPGMLAHMLPPGMMPPGMPQLPDMAAAQAAAAAAQHLPPGSAAAAAALAPPMPIPGITPTADSATAASQQHQQQGAAANGAAPAPPQPNPGVTIKIEGAG